MTKKYMVMWLDAGDDSGDVEVLLGTEDETEANNLLFEKLKEIVAEEMLPDPLPADVTLEWLEEEWAAWDMSSDNGIVSCWIETVTETEPELQVVTVLINNGLVTVLECPKSIAAEIIILEEGEPDVHVTHKLGPSLVEEFFCGPAEEMPDWVTPAGREAAVEALREWWNGQAA